MLRAVMEGVSYSLSDCNDILKEMGIDVDSTGWPAAEAVRALSGDRCWQIYMTAV